MSTDPAPTVGTLARLKLTEPVLLYLLPVAGLLLLGGLVVGAAAGEWTGALLALAGGALVSVAAWAARISTYSPAAMVQTALRARGQ